MERWISSFCILTGFLHILPKLFFQAPCLKFACGWARFVHAFYSLLFCWVLLFSGPSLGFPKDSCVIPMQNANNSQIFTVILSLKFPLIPFSYPLSQIYSQCLITFTVNTLSFQSLAVTHLPPTFFYWNSHITKPWQLLHYEILQEVLCHRN